MTAVLFVGAGQPLQAVPQRVVPPAGDEVRVRTLCCTLCRSDVATYLGERLEPTPSVLGHEVVGAIEAFGPNSPRFDAAGVTAAIGDRITWAIVAACGECFYCRHDLPAKCERGIKYGHHRTHPDLADGGGLASCITLRSGTAWFRVPDNIETPVAALANCAGATAAAVLEAAGPVAGQTVLVLGAGILGLFACALAASHGATAVIAVDPDAGCREGAKSFGATLAFDPRSPTYDEKLTSAIGRGADVALELAGHAGTVAECLARVRIGGTAVLAGTVRPTAPVPLDAERFVRRRLTLRGVHNYAPRHLKHVLDFLAGPGQVHPWASLIADTFPLERAEEAFAAAIRNPGRRVAVVPSEGMP